MNFSTDSVLSKDGTLIGYRKLGRGPGLVVVGGTMVSAQSFMQLASALSDAFTVYLPDRRGRGMSGPFGKDYGMQREVEDLDAILTKTGARYVFGVSAGGIIALQAALTRHTLDKIVLYEPALSINHSIPTDWLERYDQEIAQDKLAAALVTSMKGTQMGPPILQIMPNWLLGSLTRMAMASEEKKARGNDVTMRKLAPAMHYDFKLVMEMEGTQERFRALPAEVLLLSGSKSPGYFRVTLDALKGILPRARHIELCGLDHGGACNADTGGKPMLVAAEIRAFLIE